MADQTKGYGSVKRFGVRYGTRLKEKFGKIEAERRLSTNCPYCNYNKAERVAAGIWYCKKCKSKFTGKAYTIGRPVVVKEAGEEAAEEAAEAAGETAAETAESKESVEKTQLQQTEGMEAEGEANG